MTTPFGGYLTKVGRDRLAESMVYGQSLELTEVAVGDGGGNAVLPDENRPTLVNEVYRAGLASLTKRPDGEQVEIIAELVIPTTEGGFTIREIGLFDSDGNLFAASSFPETYKPLLTEGAAKELTITLSVLVSDKADVVLVVDKSVSFITQDAVNSSLEEHELSRNHPDATYTQRGFTRLATPTEADTGELETKAVTPAGLKQKVDADAIRMRPRLYFMGQV